MKALANQLEKMDHYFSNKKESEKWLMILGFAGIITFLAYTYLLPYAESIFKASEAKKNRLTKSIAKNESYLRSITINGDRNYYVKKLDNDIANKKNQIVAIKKKTAHINVKLTELEGMLFNEQSWSRFLDSITSLAKRYNINIEYIRDKHIDNKKNYGRVLEMELSYRADYKDVLAFMHELEQSTLVTDVHQIELSGDRSGGIYSNVKLSVWGINH
jgi:lipopolysaccharide export LptBFGC system permease protein LptF